MSSLVLEKAMMNVSDGGKFCFKAATQCRALEGQGLSPSLGGQPPQVALCVPFVGDCKFCYPACMASQATKLLAEAESSEVPSITLFCQATVAYNTKSLYSDPLSLVNY